MNRERLRASASYSFDAEFVHRDSDDVWVLREREPDPERLDLSHQIMNHIEYIDLREGELVRVYCADFDRVLDIEPLAVNARELDARLKLLEAVIAQWPAGLNHLDGFDMIGEQRRFIERQDEALREEREARNERWAGEGLLGWRAQSQYEWRATNRALAATARRVSHQVAERGVKVQLVSEEPPAPVRTDLPELGA